MAYYTKAELIERVGEFGIGSTITDADYQFCSVKSDAEVDSFLTVQYAVPFTGSVYEAAKQLSLDMGAVYAARRHRHRQNPQWQDQIDRLEELTLQALREYGKGTRRIISAPTDQEYESQILTDRGEGDVVFVLPNAETGSVGTMEDW